MPAVPLHMREFPARPDVVGDYDEVVEALQVAVEHAGLVVAQTDAGRTLHRDGCARTPRTTFGFAGQPLQMQALQVLTAGPGRHYRICRCARQRAADLAPLLLEAVWAKCDRLEARRETDREAEQARQERAERQAQLAAGRLTVWADQLGVPVDEIITTARQAGLQQA